MSRTALLDALRALDLDRLRGVLERTSTLRDFRSEKGLNLLQICCSRSTHGDPAAAVRQLRMAKWLVEQGFDPLEVHTTAPGEDGEEEPAEVSLVWFAVAKARNASLAGYFLAQGAAPHALYAAAWWGDVDIVGDLVAHGADPNQRVGATPLHMAVDVARRGTDGKPELARRRFAFVDRMLELGADPDLPASDGETPLHSALRKGYLDVFELLLSRGADPDLPGRDGRSVREIAGRKRDRAWAGALRRLAPRPGAAEASTRAER